MRSRSTVARDIKISLKEIQTSLDVQRTRLASRERAAGCNGGGTQRIPTRRHVTGGGVSDDSAHVGAICLALEPLAW